METYKPVAPVCKDCKFVRIAKLPTEKYAVAFCGHPSVYSEGDPLVINIERDFTKCVIKEVKDEQD